jgi:hypothetical protein
MSSADAYIRILYRYRSPLAVNFAHDAGPDAGALGLINVAVNVELGMHHRHVWR